MTAQKKFTKARALLITLEPFFGTLALRLIGVRTEEIETMSTDGVHLFWNPAFVERLPIAELTAVIAHEILHCAFFHFSRRGNRDINRWNDACDHAVNLILAQNRFSLPQTALRDPAYAGLSAEAIYARLTPSQQPAPSPPQQQRKPESGGAGGASPSAPSAAPGKAAAAAAPPPGSPNSPSGKPVPRPGQTPADPTLCGTVIDGPPPGTSTSRQLEGEWKIALAQADAFAKAAGRRPGGLETFIESIIRPKPDWRTRLRRFVTERACDDYRWSPPNRRHVAAGLYLPSARSQKLGEIAIGVDTSGSIGAPLLAEFLFHINAILEDAEPSAIHVLECDTKVHDARRYTPEDLPISFSAKGRGGTRFTPVFEWVEEENIAPSCLVYLTDLCCRDFPPEPSYPVLWAATRPGNAPFGEILEISESSEHQEAAPEPLRKMPR